MALEVEVLVRQRLLASPEVSALVGTRIFPVGGRPDKGPEAALPAIAYQRVSNRRLTSHEGSLGASQPLVQLSCWAKRGARCGRWPRLCGRHWTAGSTIRRNRRSMA